MPVPVYVRDAGDRIVVTNKAAVRLHQRPRRALIGATRSELHGAPAEADERLLQATGESRVAEVPVSFPDGRALWTMRSEVATRLAEVQGLIDDFGMENYTQTFRETHVWDTNWKILAENFMESYHLPVCHAGTIGRLSKLEEMDCPPGLATFNYHTILKDDSLKIALAHPDNTRMKGDRRRTTFLLAVYPSLLITLTPGYFWYLSLHPKGVGQVHIVFGGGMSPDFVNSPEARSHFAHLKTLLDKVNVEDRACTERVYRGVSAGTARAGHLSHLERPNYDFAQYLAEKTGGFVRAF